MAHFEIIVGSVLGASEYVADALQEKLDKFKHTAEIFLEPNLDQLDQAQTWIICTSTHGAGDLPDNIQAFARQLQHSKLSGLNFIIVGLGDSSYDTYCKGAMQIEELLIAAGAKLLHPALHIDVLNHPIPEDAAIAWLDSWLHSLAEPTQA
ncbi:MAG: MioC protein [Paraglaciecola sp.]|jgi:MioC protein